MKSTKVDRNDIISSGLLELYATGLASAEETQLVLQWASQYPEIADELTQIEKSLQAYSNAFAMPPGSSVKDKIFNQINQPEIAKTVMVSNQKELINKVVPIFSFWKKIAAAATFLLLGSAALNLFLFNKKNAVANQLSNTQQTLAGLQQKNTDMEVDMEVVHNKYSMPVSLTGLEAAPDAAAKIFWMKHTTGEVYIDPSNLPDAPAGKQYQLWGFVDGKPIDGGMIITSKKGSKYRIQKMKTFGRAEAFAVSLEDVKEKPGETPQGPVYVMGKM